MLDVNLATSPLSTTQRIKLTTYQKGIFLTEVERKRKNNDEQSTAANKFDG